MLAHGYCKSLSPPSSCSSPINLLGTRAANCLEYITDFWHDGSVGGLLEDRSKEMGVASRYLSFSGWSLTSFLSVDALRELVGIGAREMISYPQGNGRRGRTRATCVHPCAQFSKLFIVRLLPASGVWHAHPGQCFP